MRKPTGCCRVFLLLLPPLFLLLIGIVTLVLERITSSEVNGHTRGGTRYNGGGIYTVSGNINTSPMIAISGACIAVYIVSAINAFGIWELRRIEGTSGHQRLWAWIMLMSNLIMVGVSAGVLGYTDSVQREDAKPQDAFELTNSDLDFTRENWVCGLASFYPGRSWAVRTCGLTKGARLMLIPMTVSAALVLISIWFLVSDRGGMRWFFGGKGRYAGFPSVYELRPTSPGAQRVGPPRPQWVPYPQQWPQQPPQQWPQQAYQQWPQQQPYQSVPQQPATSLQEPAQKTDQPVFR